MQFSQAQQNVRTSKNLAVLVSELQNKAKARINSSVAQINAEDEWILKDVADRDLTEQYETLTRLSTTLAELQPTCGYVHRAKLVYYATLCCYSDK